MAAVTWQIDHGPFGLGPTGIYRPSKVPLVHLDGGRIGGPWSLVSYVPGGQQMDWWSIDVRNGSTLFAKDEEGVYNILKYVYDIIYLRAHGVDWNWKTTLSDITNTARSYADRTAAMEFLEAAFESLLPESADENTKQVWATFLDTMDGTMRHWGSSTSPPTHREVPPSPNLEWKKTLKKKEKYVPGQWTVFSDEEEASDDAYGFESEEEEGEVRNRMIRAIRANDHRAVERLAPYYK